MEVSINTKITFCKRKRKNIVQIEWKGRCNLGHAWKFHDFFSESVPEENTANYRCVSLCLIQMMGRMASTWGKVSAPGVRRNVYNNFVLFSFTLITWSILINTTILIKFVATWFHIHICRVISNPIQLPSALGRQYAPLVKLHSPSEVFSVRRHVWAGT